MIADSLRPALLFVALAVAAAGGCAEKPQIERYQVAKPIPLEPTAGGLEGQAEEPQAKPTGEPTDRMLGAILPQGDSLWFFKLMGPKDAVASLDEPFAALVKSVRFDSEGKPTWTLPEGWQEKPGPAPRYATLTAAVDAKGLETSVSMLPNSSSARTERQSLAWAVEPAADRRRATGG